MVMGARPHVSKMQEARTGNYIPIWSGLIAIDHIRYSQGRINSPSGVYTPLIMIADCDLRICLYANKTSLCFHYQAFVASLTVHVGGSYEVLIVMVIMICYDTCLIWNLVDQFVGLDLATKLTNNVNVSSMMI